MNTFERNTRNLSRRFALSAIILLGISIFVTIALFAASFFTQAVGIVNPVWFSIILGLPFIFVMMLYKYRFYGIVAGIIRIIAGGLGAFLVYNAWSSLSPTVFEIWQNFFLYDALFGIMILSTVLTGVAGAMITLSAVTYQSVKSNDH